MSSQEQYHQNYVSDFTLPLLKKILSSERKTTMTEKWNQAAKDEYSRVQAQAFQEWDQSMRLVDGLVTDPCQLRSIACTWSRIVRTITEVLEYEYTVAPVSSDSSNDIKHHTETLKRMHVICDMLKSTDHDDGIIVRGSRALEQLLRLNFGLSQDKAYSKYCTILRKGILDRMGIC